MNDSGADAKLRQQLKFLVETDALKTVFRQTYLVHDTRKENSAEHSWHLALAVMLLQEHAEEEIDLLHVLKMAIVHDLVEIYAGDTYCYDKEASRVQKEREEKAADRVFGMLPQAQGREFRKLWEEFDAMETPESRFAAALDRVQPLLQNFHSGGRSWKEHSITLPQVLERSGPIRKGSAALWQAAEAVINEATDRGYISRR